MCGVVLSCRVLFCLVSPFVDQGIDDVERTHLLEQRAFHLLQGVAVFGREGQLDRVLVQHALDGVDRVRQVLPVALVVHRRQQRLQERHHLT